VAWLPGVCGTPFCDQQMRCSGIGSWDFAPEGKGHRFEPRGRATFICGCERIFLSAKWP
jgi:hypothetical protein